MMNSIDGADGVGSACLDNVPSLSMEWVNSSMVGSPANCAESIGSVNRGSTTA